MVCVCVCVCKGGMHAFMHVFIHAHIYNMRRWNLQGTVASMGNVAQPPLRKARGERGWRAEPSSMDRFSHGESGLHCTLTSMTLALAKTPSP